MKKVILAMLVSFVGLNAMAAEEEVLNCMVSKAVHPILLFKDESTTYKGELKPGQFLVVASDGTAGVMSKVSPEQMKTRLVFRGTILLTAVFLENVGSGTVAMAGNGVSLWDGKTGIAVTCGLNK
ncbi:MAG TPA: hypothetical protein PL182_07285 [Pseudobdellovibrionaceae bacterium]|nr:hypothetical protein [Pseudobdellovibrionaceae bacterium]